MGNKRWTEKEIEYLHEKWGVISIKAISGNLKRNIGGVKAKAAIEGLRSAIKAVDGMTIPELSSALNIDCSIIYNHWIPDHNFPIVEKLVVKSKKYKFVKLKDFWKWAEKNKDIINFARIDEESLGEEPDWVKDKRRLDRLNIEKRYKHPWTKEEDRQLSFLVKTHRYTALELSKMFNRSQSAISKRCWDIGIPDRPECQTPNRDKWTEEEKSILLDLKGKGFSNNVISEKLNKSTSAVRIKYLRMSLQMKA